MVGDVSPSHKSKWPVWAAGVVALAATGFTFVWFYFPQWLGLNPHRLSASGEPITPQLPNPMDLFGKVRNRVIAQGVHPRLQAALDEWNQNGPFPIVVGSGVRTDAAQKILYAMGRDEKGNITDLSKVATYAASATQTAHGARSQGGNAIDLDPVPATKDNYTAMGKWFESRGGLIWGGRWTDKFPPNGDMRHVEIEEWASIPVVAGPAAVAGLGKVLVPSPPHEAHPLLACFPGDGEPGSGAA